MVSLDFPAALSQRVINALKADPNTVDLRAQAPHFYALGSRILELFEEEEIVDVLLEVREPYLFIDICAWLSQHWCPNCWLTNWRRRLSRSAQQTSQTTRTIPAALWEKGPISSEGWTRQNGSFFGQRMIARRRWRIGWRIWRSRDYFEDCIARQDTEMVGVSDFQGRTVQNSHSF